MSIKINKIYLSPLCLISSFSLYSLPLYAAQDAEIGAKLGYHIYDNQLSSPDSWAAGIYTQIGLTPRWGAELSLYQLGKTKERNKGGLSGGFTVADSSVRYNWLTNNQDEFFVKAGPAFWLGKNNNSYDTGVAPLVGVGYEHTLNDYWKSRIEYQFIDGLGTEKIHHTDSHLISLGLSWRATNTKGDAVTLRPATDIISDPVPATALSPSEPDPSSVSEPIMAQENKETLIIQTTHYFDIASDQVATDYRLESLFERYPNCLPTSAKYQGFADNTGSRQFNLDLSHTRAENKAQSIRERFASEFAEEIQWYGNQHFDETDPMIPDIQYRRVDVELTMQCESDHSQNDAAKDERL